jgi:hypothetical protein
VLSSAEESGLLRDLLMMDCLAMSLSWSHEDTTASEEQRIFEPILLKGDKIAAKGGKRFTIGNSKQKFVSLDMYEEIEQCELMVSTDNEVTHSGPNLVTPSLSNQNNDVSTGSQIEWYCMLVLLMM